MSRGRGQRGSANAGVSARPVRSAPVGPTPALAAKIADLRRRLNLLEDLQNDDGLSGPEFWNENSGRLRERIEPLLTEALLAGDLEAAKEIGAERYRRIGDPAAAQRCLGADHQVEAARHLFAALPQLRQLPAPLEEAARNRWAALIDLSGRLYYDWDSHATRDLRDLRDWARAHEIDELQSGLMVPRHTAVFSLEQGMARARAEIIQAGMEGPVDVDIRLSYEAFRAFCRRHQIEEINTATGTHYEPIAVAEYDCVVNGQPVRLRAIHELVPGPWMGEETISEKVAARIKDEPDWYLLEHVDLRSPHKPVGEWPNAPSGLPVMSEEAVFGPRACVHHDSSWRRSGSDLVLTCNDCFRVCVGRVPLHRCPPDHPRHQEIDEDPDSYLKALRYSAVVRDEPLDLTSSLKELRRRDGYASLDPADYATPETPERRRVPVAAPGSVAAAMARR